MEKIASLPEGRYTCKKFAVSNLGNKTIVILLLGDMPVYSYRIQEAIKNIGGIEKLKTLKKEFICELGNLCYSSTTKKKDGDREVRLHCV